MKDLQHKDQIAGGFCANGRVITCSSKIVQGYNQRHTSVIFRHEASKQASYTMNSETNEYY